MAVLFASIGIVALDLGVLRQLTSLSKRSERLDSPEEVAQGPTLQTESISEASQQPSTRTGALMAKYADSWITIRSQPTVQSRAQGYGFSGDEVTILREADGLDDRYRWYLIQFLQGEFQGWVRGDLISEQVAQSSSSRERPSAPASANHSELDGVIPNCGEDLCYTPEEMKYFLGIALGSEFGSASQQIRKWEDDIAIRIHGNPTRRDRQTLARVVNELNQLIGNRLSGGGIQIRVLEESEVQQSNVDIYFVPHSKFLNYEPNYESGNLGFAYANWNQGRIYQARILVSTTDTSQAERSHLIREELTQALGLLQDSGRYEDSIFYQGWTTTNSYLDIDRAVIQMLYHPEVLPGMDRREGMLALGYSPSNIEANHPGVHLIKRLGNAINYLRPR